MLAVERQADMALLGRAPEALVYSATPRGVSWFRHTEGTLVSRQAPPKGRRRPARRAFRAVPCTRTKTLDGAAIIGTVTFSGGEA